MATLAQPLDSFTTALSPSLVEIIAWFTLVVIIFGVFFRTGTKLAQKRGLALDDIFIFIAFAFALGETIAVHIQTKNGFGLCAGDVSPHTLSIDLKAEQAANVLYILSLCFGKFSTYLFLRNLSPFALDRRFADGLLIFTTVWTIASVFVVGFQCDLSATWDYVNGSCIDRRSFWIAYEALNIVTEVAWIAAPIPLLYRLNMKIHTKITVMSLFAFGVFNIAAEACRIWTITYSIFSSEGRLDEWPQSICAQTIQCLCITHSCILYLKPFLDSAQTGWSIANDLMRTGRFSEAQDYSGHKSQSEHDQLHDRLNVTGIDASSHRSSAVFGRNRLRDSRSPSNEDSKEEE